MLASVQLCETCIKFVYDDVHHRRELQIESSKMRVILLTKEALAPYVLKVMTHERPYGYRL